MSRLSLCAIPRDPNPYQERLYEQLRARGARADYAALVTRSRTLNLLLLPLELAWRRAHGCQIYVRQPRRAR